MISQQMTKQEILSTQYRMNDETYTIEKMMDRLHHAPNYTAAHFWHYHLTLAIKPIEKAFDDIRNEMDSMLHEKDC